MDLITQGLIGAVAAQTIAGKRPRLAALIGAVAGLLPDADGLLGLSENPLLSLEYHRHFSHALLFIPLGALLASLLLWPLLRDRLSFKALYIYSVAGYATHGLLDACTGYGTHLLWPFTDARTAWNIISIIDPVFTLALLAGLILALRRISPIPARAALGFGLLYLSFGLIQHQRAESVLREVASDRGHQPSRVLIRPTLGNLLLWRGIYEVDSAEGRHFYVDAYRTGLSTTHYPGESAPAFVPPDNLTAEQQAQLPLIHLLADNYLAPLPDNPKRIGDLRYGMPPQSVTPLWGAEIQTEGGFTTFNQSREVSSAGRDDFVDMLLGKPLD